jgi:transcriptional regulator with XRE-family HTH domain
MSLTCTDVAYVCQRCRRLPTTDRFQSAGRVVRSLRRPFPATLPGRLVGSPPLISGTSNPVRYFGRQVRKERLAAGWTLTEFGQRTGYDPAHLSRIESGKRPATEMLAQMCDQAFPHRGGWFSEFYEESRTWIATPPWFRHFVEHEQRAATLRNWFPSLLDGLLQTEDYAHAILAVSPGVTDEEVSARLAARIKRQAILTSDDRPQCGLWRTKLRCAAVSAQRRSWAPRWHTWRP